MVAVPSDEVVGWLVLPDVVSDEVVVWLVELVVPPDDPSPVDDDGGVLESDVLVVLLPDVVVLLDELPGATEAKAPDAPPTLVPEPPPVPVPVPAPAFPPSVPAFPPPVPGPPMCGPAALEVRLTDVPRVTSSLGLPPVPLDDSSPRSGACLALREPDVLRSRTRKWRVALELR